MGERVITLKNLGFAEGKRTGGAFPYFEVKKFAGDCVPGCEGGKLPDGCPITGERIINRYPTITTPAEALDAQLKSRTVCEIVLD